MVYKTLAEINQYTGASVNPLANPEQMYELYSVPSFDSHYPEVIRGGDIGSTKITVEPGDVLICKINPRINRVWVVERYTDYPLLASSEWIVVRNNQMDSNYLKWYFTSPTFRTLLTSQVAGIGGSLTRAQPKQVAKYPVPVMDLSNQKQIASTLDKLETLISLRKEQLAKLDELVKARFVEMFGDPVANEKKWPLVSLSEIAEIKIGPFGTLLHKEDYLSGGHALVNPSHIIDGKIVTDDNLTISDEKYTELSAYHLLPGDIVMGRRGEMGRCAVVYESGLLCGTGSLIIRPNEHMKPYFLQSILSSPGYKKIIEDKAVGVTMPNLNVPIVSSLTVPQLPVDLQKDFIRFMEKTDETKLTIQASLDKLEVMKKALMQDYFG